MTIHYGLWQGAPILHVHARYAITLLSARQSLSRRGISCQEDDDDIDWKHNPFDVDFIDDERESPEQLMSKITLAAQQGLS
jgi:hypothetical protein